MMKVYEIIQHLASKGSTKFKLEELKKHSDNVTLREFFCLCLDKQLNFYIKKIPQHRAPEGKISLDQAMASLRKLSDRVFTGRKATIYLSKLLTECDESDSEVLKLLIKRDPSCGVSVSTVNKVWPDLVEVWPCSLCERSTEKNLANIVYPAIAQEKADGMRINFVYKDGEITVKSRNGSFVNLHGLFDDEVKKIQKFWKTNIVIDAEGLVLDENGNIMDRAAGNGILNKAIKNTITLEEASRVRIKMWEIIPLDIFKSKKEKSIEKYIKNLMKIKHVLTVIDLKLFSLIRTTVVHNKKEALKFYKEMLELGKEGAILKNFDSVWEDDRQKDRVKLKIEEEVELVVVDWIEHKKKKGWIGALICESSDGLLRVKVGSGLKDPDRKKDPIHYMNKIVTVVSNGPIKSKGKDTMSLFLPRFPKKGDFVRLDKDEAQTLDDIIACFDKFLEGV